MPSLPSSDARSGSNQTRTPKQGAVFVYITGETSPEEEWKNSLTEIHGDHYRLTDKQWQEISNNLHIPGIPVYFLLDRKGEMVFSNLTEGGYPGNDVVKKGHHSSSQPEISHMLLTKMLQTFGEYLVLMGRVFSRPERLRMFWKRYVKEMAALGVDSIIIVLLISFFIGAVICIQIKLNIESAWMPKWVSGYVTREIMLLEFSSSIMCLILAGKVGSNIASEIGTMRVTQQIDALEIMGVNSASYVILPKIVGMLTMIPLLVIFSTTSGIVGAYATAYIGHIITPAHLTEGIQYDFNQWYFWMGVIKSFFFAFIIATVSAFYGYRVEGGSVEVGKASTDAVVSSSMLVLFSDLFLTQLLS